MKSAPFTYHAPCTIDEATALLKDLSAQDAYVLAGGQSLVPAMALRLARPNHLIDINGITGLDDVVASDQDLRHRRAGSTRTLSIARGARATCRPALSCGATHSTLSDPATWHILRFPGSL